MESGGRTTASVAEPAAATGGSRTALDYATVRAFTEQLAAPLSAEDQTAQSMPDVSPTKWHRAHTTWFFETFLLERFVEGYEPFDPCYRQLFNSYYEAVGPRYPRPDRGVITRPGAAEIGEYRRIVDDRMNTLLSSRHADDPELTSLLELGLHHEQQHQELLLMDIKHVLSLNPLRPAYRRAAPADPHPASSIEWIDVDGGLTGIGHDGAGFAYDNESPRHAVYLEPYCVASRLVTCGEWFDFIADDGYARPDLWLSDGWDHVSSNGWEAPLYWHRDGSDWLAHTLQGTVAVDPASPVEHVSFYEAEAFARWSGARLPTEAEWEHAVTEHAGRLIQRDDSCWQWTASAYLPYPGFEPAAGAVGEYNGKFMSGQMVLRGGSTLTSPGHTRPTYRNFFPPSARWPMTGLRLASGTTRTQPDSTGPA